MIWFTLALFVVSFLVTAFLSPKPKVENARAGGLDDLRFPTSSEGSPVPLVIGKVRLRGPNTLWYGQLNSVAITQKVSTGLFSSKTQTTGFEYYLTFHLGLCLGPDVKLHKIWCEKDVIWTGELAATGEQTITINNTGLFGGAASGGGLAGVIRYYGGAFDQPQNAKMNSVLNGADTPAFRGLAHAVFEDFYIGTATQLRTFSFEVSRYTNQLGLAEDVRIIGEDINIAEALYDILVSDWGGMDVDPANINAASFVSCAATLAAEGNGISLIVSKSNSGRQVIEELLRQADGILYQDPSTAEINFRLIRQDYDVESIPVLDPSNVQSVRNFAVTSWEDTVNQLRVQFTNRSNGYENGMAMTQDMANINSQGRLRGTAMSFPGVNTADLAVKLATREQAQLGVPIYKTTLEVNRTAATLRPGDPFVFSWPDYNIEQVVLRVQRFDLGELVDGKVVIDCVQDQFASGQVVFAAPAQSTFEPISRDPQPIAQGLALEVPYWLWSQLEGAAVPAASTSFGLTLARRPNAQQAGWRSDMSSDDFAAVTVAGAGPFAPFQEAGLLVGAIDRLDGFSTGSIASIQLEDPVPLGILTSATTTQMRTGVNLFAIDNELFSFETAVDSGGGLWTLSNVQRALLDTEPADHANGAGVFFIDVEGVSDVALVATGDVDARVWSQTDKGESNVLALTRTFNRRHERPLPPDYVRLNATRVTDAEFTDGASVTATWAERNRLDAGIAFEADGTITPEASTTYNAYLILDNVTVLSNTGLASPTTTFFLTVLGAGQVEVEAVRGGLVSYTRAFYPLSVVSAPVGIGTVRFFDTYSGLTIRGCWALRKRVSTWTGALIRIRDTTGGAEQDVGFNATTGELNSYTVTGSARVVRVYDQTGEGDHLEQTVSGNQPLLTTNATGKPVISFAGNNKWLDSTFTGSTASPTDIHVATPEILISGERGTQTNTGYIVSMPNIQTGAASGSERWSIRATNSPSTQMQVVTEGSSSNILGTILTSENTRYAALVQWGTRVASFVTGLFNAMGRLDSIQSFDGSVNFTNSVKMRVGDSNITSFDSNTTNDFLGSIAELVIFTGAVDRSTYEPALMTELCRGLTQNETAHRYWRVVCDEQAGAAAFSLATLQFRSTVSGSNIATGGTAFASTTAGGTSAANAFDGDGNTVWRASTSALGQSIGYDLGSGNDAVVREIVIASINDANFSTRSPMAGRVQWSDDGTTYTTDWCFATDVAWTQAQTRTFSNPSI